MGNTYDRL